MLESESAGVIVRQSTNNWYSVSRITSGRIGLYKTTGGSQNTLNTWTVTFVVGAILRLEINSNVLRVLYNGTEVGTYDDSASPLGSGKAGITAYGITGNGCIDDWEGGDLGGEPPPASPILTIRSGFFRG